MIIVKDVNGISDVTHKSYILCHDGKKVIFAYYQGGQATTKKNILEVFDEPQKMVDRVVELGLLYTLEQAQGAIDAGLDVPHGSVEISSSEINQKGYWPK